MNTRVLGILLVIAIIVLAVLLGALYIKSMHTTPSQPVGTNQNPFGNAVSTSTNTTTTPGDMMTIKAKDGSVFKIPDVTKSAARTEHENSGTYYYLTNNQETQDNPEFDIVYGTDYSISIALLKEPLGQSRLDAEKKVRELFPLSASQICSLDVTVSTPAAISDQYSGYNLGLSFCQGSVALPS